MAFNHSPQIVKDNLVLYLDAGSPKSYGGSGTTWTDISRNGNNGTLVNGVSYSNRAMVFDGVDDSIEIPVVLQPTTIDISIKTSNRNNSAIIYANQDAYNSGVWQWSLYYYNNELYWRADGGGGGVTITNFIPLDKWCNIVIVRQSPTSLCYINGILVSTASLASVPTVTGTIKIGKAGPNFWQGSVSSLKMYNRALSPAEILQNYNATKGRYGL